MKFTKHDWKNDTNDSFINKIPFILFLFPWLVINLLRTAGQIIDQRQWTKEVRIANKEVILMQM